MANVNIPNLPVAIGLTGAELVPIVQAGGTVRTTTAAIANTATGFLPATAIISAGSGIAISNSGLLINDPTISLNINGLAANTAMLVADSFAINDVADGNLPRKVTFPNAMKALTGLSALVIPNLLNDYLIINHAADGLTYKISPSALGLAAGNVPAGGTTGQVLAKNSNTNYDTAWINNSLTLSAYSIAANTTGSTATSTSLSGTQYQVLRIGAGGTSLAFGQIDISQSAAIVNNLPLANGGLNASLAASNGGIFYSTASAGAILAGTATANQALLSGSSATPAWSTATYPATTTINQLLYSSSANTIVGLATANGGILNASATGVPSLTVTPVLGLAGTSTGTIGLSGSGSGVVTIQPQAAAGTFNFNLPITAGTSGLSLLSGGGGSSPMTWGHDAAAGITVGTTTITGGTNTRILYDNSGVLGEYTLTGTGTVAVMQTSPSLVTPALGVATATSLAINGATIGSNGLAVTGGIAGSAQIWAGTVSSALSSLTGSTDGYRNSSANVTQFAGENTTSSSATQGGFFGGYSNDGAALASGDRLGGIRVGGSSSASALRNAALIGAFASQAWVDGSAYGSRWEFQTTTNTATSATTKLILGNAGVLSFGTTEANTVPALKPSSTTLQVRLGDDSAFTAISASELDLNGSSSGTVSVLVQAASGTFNFNLPTTAGTSTYVLTSAGGGSSPMTWTNPSSLAIALVVGSTAITSGTNTRILYDNSGTLGEYTITGTGTVVAMQTSPSFTTPTLGVATATSINKMAITAPATSSTLAVADGKTLTASVTMTLQGGDSSVLSIAASKTFTASNTLTLTGTDSTSFAFPSVSDTVGCLATAQTWTKQNIHNVATTITSSTGAALDDLKVSAATTTITGNTGSPITRLAKVGLYQPTLTDASAVTVTDAATLYIDNAPTAGGSVTITNAWSLLVGAGNVKFAGSANAVGTITSGTWNGSTIGVTYGGTGISNPTAHDLLIGNGSSAMTQLAPSATSGVPLVSQGSSSDPAYGTAVVAGGGTGNTTFTAYSVICAGTTATGVFQNVSGLGNSGQVLASQGAGALPHWIDVSGTGTVTSITPGSGLVSSVTADNSQTAITTAGTLYRSEVVNAQTGTSYTIADGDRSKLVTFSNASAIAVTLPQASTSTSFVSGWCCDVVNKGAGAVTITPTTSTINGAATLVLQTGQGCRIVADGTNYQISFTPKVTGPSSATDGAATLFNGTTGQLVKDSKVILTIPASAATLTLGSGKTVAISNSLTLAGTDSTTMTFPGVSSNIGYLEVPQNSQSNSYTTVLTDSGKHIYETGASKTITIDSNANVAYPIGAALTFVSATNAVTIAITTDTLIQAGTGSTGSRTLAANSMATAIKITSTSWIISGAGLT